jgi:hypothetical protein
LSAAGDGAVKPKFGKERKGPQLDSSGIKYLDSSLLDNQWVADTTVELK